jgi:hypothetical protein
MTRNEEYSYVHIIYKITSYRGNKGFTVFSTAVDGGAPTQKPYQRPQRSKNNIAINTNTSSRINNTNKELPLHVHTNWRAQQELFKRRHPALK